MRIKPLSIHAESTNVHDRAYATDRGQNLVSNVDEVPCKGRLNGLFIVDSSAVRMTSKDVIDQ